MDRDQQDLQSLGLLGIYRESYRLIFRFWKIFSQITLTLILPLSFIFLSHNQISNILQHWISREESRPYNHTSKHSSPYGLFSSQLLTYILIKAVYFTFFLVFSLLSTSAIVYTIACIYTSRHVTFNNVIKSVVPRVWKRLMVTFLCALLGFWFYNIVYVITLFSVYLYFTIMSDNYVLGQAIVYIILALYALGFVYMSIIWQLASVVTVLEESYGFGAMIKSKGLIKGKLMVVLIIFFKLNLSLAVISGIFPEFISYRQRDHFGTLKRIGIGAVCLLLLLQVILFALVVQTVIYFVCKSYHNENIDKLDLSYRLEGYLGEYVALEKAVSLQEFDA